MGQVQNKEQANDESSFIQDISTKHILDMFMHKKLRDAGYRAFQSINEHEHILNALLERSTEVEHIFRKESDVQFDNFDLLAISQTFLFGVLNEIIQNSEHTWGTVYAIFAFTGMLFDHLVEKRRINSMYAVVDNINNFMSVKKLNTWIDEKGGWKMFPANSIKK